MQKKMMKLTLQPLVENSITHGILPDGEAEENIMIAGWTEGDDLIITVSDNGIGMTEEKLFSILVIDEANTHYAVSNIHERMIMKYGDCLLYTSRCV